jgi:two-component system, cell cycle response regulator CpdR
MMHSKSVPPSRLVYNRGGDCTMLAEINCRTARILVVDDDAQVLDVMADVLEGFGYLVLRADSGEKALHLLQSEPDIKMLISDIRMPGISGVQLADAAVMDNPALQVLLVSAYATHYPTAHRLLRKPFHLADFESAVGERLGGTPCRGGAALRD